MQRDTGRLLGPPSRDLFQISHYSLAGCNHSPSKCSEIGNQNFLSQINSTWQNQTSKMPLTQPCEMAASINSEYTECNSSSVKCERCFIHGTMGVGRRALPDPTNSGLCWIGKGGAEVKMLHLLIWQSSYYMEIQIYWSYKTNYLEELEFLTSTRTGTESPWKHSFPYSKSSNSNS